MCVTSLRSITTQLRPSRSEASTRRRSSDELDRSSSPSTTMSWMYSSTPSASNTAALMAPQFAAFEGTARSRAKQSPVPRTATHALTLSAEIRQRFDTFSRSQKDVGQYIVDHLDEAAFHTAEELARRANTSSSTVVRFAQALGFEGFPELQASAREEYRRRHAGGETDPAASAQPLFPIDQTEFEAALAADHVNVVETARKIDRDEVAAAIERISRAERIL